MKISIPDAVRVGESTDYKGNPVVVLEIFGQSALYADPEVLNMYDKEDWRDIFALHVSGILADLILERTGSKVWRKDSPTGRDVHNLGPEG